MGCGTWCAVAISTACVPKLYDFWHDYKAFVDGSASSGTTHRVICALEEISPETTAGLETESSRSRPLSVTDNDSESGHLKCNRQRIHVTQSRRRPFAFARSARIAQFAPFSNILRITPPAVLPCAPRYILFAALIHATIFS